MYELSKNINKYWDSTEISTFCPYQNTNAIKLFHYLSICI